MRKIFWIAFLCTLFSCNQEQETVVVPDDAIAVNYDSGWIFPLKLYDAIPGNFLFDTGCYGMLLDSLYLVSIPLDTTGKTGAHTLYGSGEGRQETKYISGPIPARLDTLPGISPHAIITQLKPMSGKSLDGIVGWDYLKNHVVEFNVDGRYIRLIAPDSLQNFQGYHKVSLIREGDFWYITAKVAIADSLEIEGDFLFDTGYGGDIRFVTTVAEQNNFSVALSDTIAFYTKRGGFGGKSGGASFRAKSVTIGNMAIKAPILSYSRDKDGILSVENYKGFYRNHKGLFGAGLLSRFNVIIDWPRGCLYLRPSKDFDREDKMGRSGFSYVDRTDICDGFIVNSLQQYQNAEEAGLQLGDTITHINKKAVKGLLEGEIGNIWKKAKNVNLTVRRGNSIQQIKLPLTDKKI